MCKIIVLTPVKNEDWILEQFLTVTSMFADHIIIADQNSTDNSRQICSRFPKVHLIENGNQDFCEDDRQILLIETARKLYPGQKRILLSLDADEIFSANSLHFRHTWNRIRNLPLGTSLYFERSDLLCDPEKCIRGRNHNLYFPLGYVDDGMAHQPSIIHSRRIPHNPDGINEYIDEIKIVHFIFSRMKVRHAKIRYYTVLENIKKTNRFYIRRYAYNRANVDNNMHPERIEATPSEWLKGWTERHINLQKFHEPDFSWQDFEVLKLFKNYGYRRFYLDDIWDFDWESCTRAAENKGIDVSSAPISKPNSLMVSLLKSVDALYILSRKLRFKNVIS